MGRLLAMVLGLSAGASLSLSVSAGAVLGRTQSALPTHVRVQFVDRGATVVKDVGLEAYVSAAAVSEFAPPDGDPAVVEKMLEIQAIIGRTYAVSRLGRHARDGFDLCSTTHCQLYEPGRLRTSRWAPSALEAAARTAGLVLRFEGEPAEALFHADCGGRTSSATDVWGGVGRSYLVSRADGGLADQAHVRWEYEVAKNDLASALRRDPRTRVDGQLTGVTVVRRDGAGRAWRVAIKSRGGSREVRGEDLRDVVARAFGARTLRSTWFDIDDSRTSITFKGRGYGHGVGLCQAGALARLTAGARPKDVIAFYYPGTVLQ
jgi:stage II sporulation protein D